MSQKTPKTEEEIVRIDVSFGPCPILFIGADSVVRADFARALELECARLAQEKAELVDALQTIVDLDDGDTPDLWHFEKEFGEAREVLAAIKGA